MLCYRDMTFCSASCASMDCRHQFTEAERAKARAWWGGEGAPIAMSDFSESCPEYQPRDTTP